jgi:predicted RNA-binding Zn-ribbon protein involved in translation (DUF1610 family)
MKLILNMLIIHPITKEKIRTRGYVIYDPKYSLFLCPVCGAILNNRKERDENGVPLYDCHGHPLYLGQDCMKCGWENLEHKEYNSNL